MAVLWPFEIPITRGEGQLKCQLVWAVCQASQGYVWWGAFQLSAGKEHGVYLSAGIYLDKQENILPPNLIGTGILLSIGWLKQCRALQNISDQLASLAAEFASVQKHTADHVSVLTSLQHLPWDETLGLQRS